MDNSKNIPVQVKNRVAWTGWGGYIICGNTDYTVTFTFDEEWGEATAKTARFKFRTDEGMRYTDQPFTGNTVAVPMLSNIREVEVGVYVGDLNTTTGATIRCVPSILCGSGEQSEYEKKRFDELMQLFNDTLHGHENLKTLAKFACMAADMEQDDGLTILPDVVGVDRATFWGNYLRYCSDGGVVKSVEEIEREGTKYLRLRFDMGPLVTNFDVPEFIDIPVALVTERVEEVPGPGLGTNSTGLELDLGVGSGGGGSSHEHANKELLDSITADALGNFRVIVENPAISFSGALRSDKYYIFTNPAKKIAVTSLLNVGSANIIPEYIFEFTVGDTLTRLSLPKACVWSNSDIPTIKAYKKYIIRIVGNVATYSEVSI